MTKEDEKKKVHERPKDWLLELMQGDDSKPYEGSARSLRGEVAAAERKKQKDKK
ncbi:MAG: hypothetical protein ACON4W_09020 [Parvibaculales bacterium]